MPLHLVPGDREIRSPSQLELRLLEQVAAIRGQGAAESGDVAYLSRVVVQANLPYRDPGSSSFVRRAGKVTLTLQAPPDIGLPYGRYPRLLLAWIGREAVRTRSRELRLGGSLSAFLRELGIGSSGGRHGPLGRFREQARRLFATTVSCHWRESGDGRVAEVEVGHRIAAESLVWWASARSGAGTAGTLDGGRLVLSAEFFEELLAHPVPVDLRALKALQAPLALDVYAWLTWRSEGLERPLRLSWAELAMQFGTRAQRVRDFRAEFRKALARVRLVYPEVRVEATTEALIVYPARGHVSRRPRRV